VFVLPVINIYIILCPAEVDNYGTGQSHLHHGIFHIYIYIYGESHFISLDAGDPFRHSLFLLFAQPKRLILSRAKIKQSKPNTMADDEQHCPPAATNKMNNNNNRRQKG
jgi:hypothetical protein